MQNATDNKNVSGSEGTLQETKSKTQVQYITIPLEYYEALCLQAEKFGMLLTYIDAEIEVDDAQKIFSIFA